MATITKSAKLKRIHFETSRELDFFAPKELIAQTGHEVREWPLVCLKELLDNSLDACEEADTAPEITVEVADEKITVADNGPGIPDSVVESVLDFSIRVSSREAYVAPCRGAQGNALKTLVAMPFALCGQGCIVIESLGIRHEIQVSVDQLKQEPRIEHRKSDSDLRSGTRISIDWPHLPSSIKMGRPSPILQIDDRAPTLGDSPSLILEYAKSRFLQIVEDYCWLNPHLSLCCSWGSDQELVYQATDTSWRKWLPSTPTDPHWYSEEDLRRLIAANIVHKDRLVREFVAEFRGLSGSLKQKKVLEASGLSRKMLSDLLTSENAVDQNKTFVLLAAMKSEVAAVKPKSLGVIGRDHLKKKAALIGSQDESFQYKQISDVENGRAWIAEVCFAYCPVEGRSRRIVTGVNWSPGIKNPFRNLGTAGRSLDAVLEKFYVGADEPTVFILHLAKPGVQYSDRGKSSIVIED